MMTRLSVAPSSLEQIAQQVVRHRPRRRDVLDLQRDRVRLDRPDPDRQRALVVRVAQDDDRHVRDRVDHQTLDRHLDQHGLPPVPRARPRREGCSAPAAVIRTRTSSPNQSARPGEVDDDVAAGAAGRLPRSAAARRESTSTSSIEPTAACEPLDLDVSLQRLERHDPPRLLRLRHVVRHPLDGERVRTRRVLERVHRVIAGAADEIQRLARSPRRSRRESRR